MNNFQLRLKRTPSKTVSMFKQATVIVVDKPGEDWQFGAAIKWTPDLSQPILLGKFTQDSIPHLDDIADSLNIPVYVHEDLSAFLSRHSGNQQLIPEKWCDEIAGIIFFQACGSMVDDVQFETVNTNKLSTCVPEPEYFVIDLGQTLFNDGKGFSLAEFRKAMDKMRTRFHDTRGFPLAPIFIRLNPTIKDDDFLISFREFSFRSWFFNLASSPDFPAMQFNLEQIENLIWSWSCRLFTAENFLSILAKAKIDDPLLVAQIEKNHLETAWKVFKKLLEQKVPIKETRVILNALYECVLDGAPKVDEILVDVRSALFRKIFTTQHEKENLRVIKLTEESEKSIKSILDFSEFGERLCLFNRFANKVTEAVKNLSASEDPLLLVVERFNNWEQLNFLGRAVPNCLVCLSIELPIEVEVEPILTLDLKLPHSKPLSFDLEARWPALKSIENKAITRDMLFVTVAKTSEDLSRWAKDLQNCLGNGSWYKKIISGESIIIGLRDRSKRIHYAFEFTTDKFDLKHAKGPGNSDVPRCIKKKVVQILKEALEVS